MVSTFKKYPPKYLLGYFLKGNPGVLLRFTPPNTHGYSVKETLIPFTIQHYKVPSGHLVKETPGVFHQFTLQCAPSKNLSHSLRLLS